MAGVEAAKIDVTTANWAYARVMVIRSNTASRQIVNHLITFIAVAETRNFRRAAEL